MYGLTLACVLTAAGGGQQASEPPTLLEDVEVLGRRGAATVAPEIELGAEEIDALGAYDIGEAVRRLAADYALGDAPTIIVNGRRMADPGVFSGFPPDALVRLEVLPPEAGALYGAADPSRRVVNIVLQRRFHSRDGRASLRRPTAGGMTSAAGDLRQSSILDAGTRHLGLQVAVDTALRAGERDQDRGDAPDAGAVTLRSPSETVAIALARTGEIGDWSASLNANARVQETRSVSHNGDETVESRRRSQSLMMTGGLNGEVAGWSIQAALNGALSHADQSGLSASDTRQRTVMASLGLNRPLFDLPAGPVAVSLSGRGSRSRSVSERSVGTRTFSGRASDLNGDLSIPLLRRSPDVESVAGVLGDLSLTFGANLSETDAGRGDGLNAGLAWMPAPKLRFNGNWSTATQSLPDQQRFDPEYYGEPIVVFDFLTGEAVEVLPILGGNPNLRQPSSDQISLSASAGPFTAWSLQGALNYQRGEARDELGVVPDPTPEVEAAFPDRFRRDADGRLVSIDRRPINVASALTETLTTNLGAAFPLAPRSGTGAGVLRVTFNHNWQVASATTLRDGLPEMDRLAGDGGGLSRHQVGFAFDVQQGRWGANAAARWRDGYRIRRDSGRDGPDDLRVGAFSAVDLKFSYRLEGRLPAQGDGGRARRGVGLQLELEVANLFDARPSARLADGRPAPGYGRDDQDPVGRTVLVTLKRRF